jgi:hypothetical protein
MEILEQVASWPLGVIAVGIAVVVVALTAARWWLLRVGEHVRRTCPQHLLHELCVAHRLGPAERKMIQRLAKERKLAHPALLFLEPLLWDAGQLGAFGQRHAAALASLQRQVFDDSPPPKS